MLNEIPFDIFSRIFLNLDFISLAWSVPQVSKDFYEKTNPELESINDIWKENVSLYFPRLFQLLKHRKNVNWHHIFRTCSMTLIDNNFVHTFIHVGIGNIGIYNTVLRKNNPYASHPDINPRERKWMRNLLYFIDTNNVENIKTQLNRIPDKSSLTGDECFDYKIFQAENGKLSPFELIVFKQTLKNGNPKVLKQFKSFYNRTRYYNQSSTYKFMTRQFVWDILCRLKPESKILERIKTYANPLQLVQNITSDLNINIFQGIRPIHLAARAGYLNIVKYYVDYSLECLEQEDNKKRTPIDYAAASGQLQVVKYLISKNCQLYFPRLTLREFPSLHYAVKSGQFNVVQYLLDECKINNARLNFPNYSFYYHILTSRYLTTLPVFTAARKNHIQIADYLSKKIWMLKPVDNLLITNSLEGNIGIVKYITNNINYPTKEIFSAFKVALMSNRASISNYLYTKLKSDEFRIITSNILSSNNLLYVCIYSDNDLVLNALLKAKLIPDLKLSALKGDPYNDPIADVDHTIILYPWVKETAINPEGETLLTLAIKSKADECIVVLLENKANPNLANDKGELPLILAIQNNSTGNINALLKNGADPFQFDQQGNNFVSAAITSESKSILTLLGLYFTTDSSVTLPKLLTFYTKYLERDYENGIECIKFLLAKYTSASSTLVLSPAIYLNNPILNEFIALNNLNPVNNLSKTSNSSALTPTPAIQIRRITYPLKSSGELMGVMGLISGNKRPADEKHPEENMPKKGRQDTNQVINPTDNLNSTNFQYRT